MRLEWKKFKSNGKKVFQKEFWKKDRLLILFLTGVLLLVISIPDGGRKLSGREQEPYLSDDAKDGAGTEEEYIHMLEKRLENILSRMEGAGEVSVMITLAASKERVIEKDTQESSENIKENDSQGGSRSTQNVTRSEEAVYDGADGNNKYPYVSKELSPRVEGVVVIAPGGDNAVVVKNITEAVQALFGIDTHKIRIVKGRREA